MLHFNCYRCRRPLKTEKAQRAGIGKTCAEKIKRQSINQLKLALVKTKIPPGENG